MADVCVCLGPPLFCFGFFLSLTVCGSLALFSDPSWYEGLFIAFLCDGATQCGLCISCALAVVGSGARV